MVSFTTIGSTIVDHYTLASLSNHDDDHNDDFKKTIGLMTKTTALRVHRAF